MKKTVQKQTEQATKGHTATGQTIMEQTERPPTRSQTAKEPAARGQTAIEYLFIIAATVTFVTVVTYFVKTNVVK